MASALPPGFDTHAQDFTLYDHNGEQFVTNMGEVDYLRQWGIRTGINWGTQIGASVVLLVVLLLLTRREKRNSSIFVMNCLCLVLNAIRSIMQCVWLTTEMFHPYAILAGDYSRVTPSNRANTITCETVLLILIAFIMVSLSLQVWVVCITAKPWHRILIMGITSLVACVAVGYRFAVCVLTNMHTMRDLPMTEYNKLVLDMHIAQAVAVWVYCCVFTFKLGRALMQRKRMRMTQFGAMQIIFIMGCQTMIIPAIFTSLQTYPKVPELASQNTTIICIFLPLSAIWAGLVSNDPGAGARGADGHQQLLRDQFYSPSPKGSTIGTDGSPSRDKGSISTYTSSAKDPESPATAFAPNGVDHARSDAIYVGREYTIESGEASKEV